VVPNGVIDLRTGALTGHYREHMITRMSHVEYDPDARDARWDLYLKQATNGDEDLARYLQRAAGYTLTGSTREEILFMLHGPPASGKSTFVTAIQTALGEYAFATASENLMHKRGRAGGPPRDEVASWRGARMVASVEPSEGDRWDESTIKQLTGGDRITGRHLYKDRFEFLPAFKLWLATNSAPRTRDQGMFRRIRRVPFPVRIERKNRDLSLKDWLNVPDSPGARAVLAWAVRGAVIWNDEGVGTCRIVEEDTEEYRSEQDIMAQFIEECLRVHGNMREGVRVSEVYRVYAPWVEREMGEHPWTQITFTRKLKEMEYRFPFRVKTGKKLPVLLGVDLIGERSGAWPAGGV
jgi:putative DNA primase/helicase